VRIEVELPPTLRRFIREVGYGDNSKVMAGFRSRPWRARGESGAWHTDLPFQSCWDSSQMQPGAAGVVTWFVGGEAGRRVADGTPEEWVQTFVAGLDRVTPGIAAERSGTAARFSWPTFPWSRGSYLCFRPGQYSGFARRHMYMEGDGLRQDATAGRLVFAGEHVSDEYQGYMNGAAQTGRLAAQAVLRAA
jgi:monoamine oxidase